MIGFKSAKLLERTCAATWMLAIARKYVGCMEVITRCGQRLEVESAKTVSTSSPADCDTLFHLFRTHCDFGIVNSAGDWYRREARGI